MEIARAIRLLNGFHEARIEPLAPEAIEKFLDHWCRGLYPESPQMAEAHRKELSEALRVLPNGISIRP